MITSDQKGNLLQELNLLVLTDIVKQFKELDDLQKAYAVLTYVQMAAKRDVPGIDMKFIAALFVGEGGFGLTEEQIERYLEMGKAKATVPLSSASDGAKV